MTDRSIAQAPPSPVGLIESYELAPRRLEGARRPLRSSFGGGLGLAAIVGLLAFLAGSGWTTGALSRTAVASPVRTGMAVSSTALASPAPSPPGPSPRIPPQLPPPGGIPLNAALHHLSPETTTLSARTVQYGDVSRSGAVAADRWVWAVEVEWHVACPSLAPAAAAECPTMPDVTELVIVDYFTGAVIESVFPARDP